MSRTEQTDMLDGGSLRAPVYGLLASLLARPPDAGLLRAVAALEGDRSDFGQALAELAAMAARSDADQVMREYNDLFIGVTRGELVPYASYYRTGFLHDRPLAKVRDDLARLRLERAPGVAEPEDHIAGLLEVMALLCADDTVGASQQSAFFATHVSPWAVAFFSDLQGAGAASFYRPVARLALIFLDIEERFARLADEEAETGLSDIPGGFHAA